MNIYADCIIRENWLFKKSNYNLEFSCILAFGCHYKSSPCINVHIHPNLNGGR